MTPADVRTVLLVDDDATIRTLLQQVLVNAGYQVIAASDGQEALTLFDAQPDAIDVVITDLKMPKMHGVDLARRLLERKAALPIIFITGSTGTEAFPTPEEFPNHVLLRKPFLPSELVAELARLFG